MNEFKVTKNEVMYLNFTLIFWTVTLEKIFNFVT